MGKPRPDRPNIPSNFRQLFVNCSCEMKTYGQCVASKAPAIEYGTCAEEFMALNKCILNVLKNKKSP